MTDSREAGGDPDLERRIDAAMRDIERNIKADKPHALSLGGQVASKTAAKVIGVSQSTLKDWRSKEKGPCYVRRNDRVWYPLRDLARYLETDS